MVTGQTTTTNVNPNQLTPALTRASRRKKKKAVEPTTPPSTLGKPKGNALSRAAKRKMS